MSRPEQQWEACQWRYLCPKCGRFLADSRVQSVDVWDPIGSWYGWRTDYRADCPRCGAVTPIERVTAVRAVTP